MVWMKSNGSLAAACVAAVAVAVVGTAEGETVLPVFSPADFDAGAPVDHPYFPQVPGTIRVYEGLAYDEDEDELVPERVVEEVLFDRRTVAGIDAVVVYSQEWVDGLRVEATRDWFAQDRAGNVWYLGEDTTEFYYDDDGNPTGSEDVGAWEAGINDAQPGYQMPSVLTPGFSYYQEFAPDDEAVDQGEIIALAQMIEGPLGPFDDVLWTVDSTALEPGVLENKYFARGLGLIRTEGDFDNGGTPRTIIELTSVSAVPSPSAAVSGLMGLGALALRRRRATAD